MKTSPNSEGSFRRKPGNGGWVWRRVTSGPASVKKRGCAQKSFHPPPIQRRHLVHRQGDIVAAALCPVTSIKRAILDGCEENLAMKRNAFDGAGTVAERGSVVEASAICSH